MAQLPVVIYPHPTLKAVAQPVTTFDSDLHRFLENMAETMYASNGVGLAANQVDDLRRVFVVDCAAENEPPELKEFINPRIVAKEGAITWHEGCLSLPDLFADVKRANKVTLEYVDRRGAPQQIDAEGLLAVAIQHELDHLDGVMFIDRLGVLDRRAALRRWDRLVEKRKASL